MLNNAARCGYVKTVSQLLQRGAHFDTCNDGGLSMASKNGHTEIVKMLLNAGMDVHWDNYSALRYAKYVNNLDIVQLLLDAGANTIEGMQALANEDQKKAINRLNFQDALLDGSRTGNIKSLEYILKRAGNLNRLDPNQRALRESIRNDKRAMVEFLLNNGADIHAFDECALEIAVDNKNIEIVRFLLDRGANPYFKHSTILQSAVECSQTAVIILLLDKISNIPQMDAEVIQILSNALTIAIRLGNKEIANLLLNRFPEITSALHGINCEEISDYDTL